MPTDTAIAMSSVDNITMQLYLELLSPSLSLTDALNVTAYAAMSCDRPLPSYALYNTLSVESLPYLSSILWYRISKTVLKSQIFILYFYQALNFYLYHNSISQS